MNIEKLKRLKEIADNLCTNPLVNSEQLGKLETFNSGIESVKDIISNFTCPLCCNKYNKAESTIIEVSGEKHLVKTTGKSYNNGFFGSSGTEITSHSVQEVYKVRICKECAPKGYQAIDIQIAIECNALVND